MFIKAFRIKSSSQMKSSDKKKFRAEVRKKFPYFSQENVDQDALNDLVPNKEDIMVTKIETFGGDSVLLYHKGKASVLFFEHEKDKIMFPSLLTLWKYPDMMPTLTTSGPVVSRLANGADLMLPGVLVNDKLGTKAYCDGKLQKDDVMSVNLVVNKAPVAVGTAALSSEDMYMSGKRGKALKTVHCIGDQLWVHYGRPELPDLGVPDNLGFLDEKNNDDSTEDEEFEKIPKVDEEFEQMPNAEEVAAIESIENLDINDDDQPVTSAPVQAAMSEPEELDLDVILEDAFIRACKTTAKKAEFPILTSNFFRLHVVPACPPYCPTLDVKKTKWKKLSKFLAEKQTEGIITIKEPKKGVETITDINQDHPRILQFKVIKYEVPEKEENGKDKNEFAPPVIDELYIVTGNEVALLFKECGINKGTALSPPEVRELVKGYVTKNGLQNEKDKSMVNLDPVLAQAVLVKGENNVITIKWEKITSRITNKMSKGYAMTQGGSTQVMKGKVDIIEMTLGKRSGNKKVTLIHNLDVYGIDPKDFGHKCQVGVAASSTVNEAANKKKSNGQPVIEVLVQGNQVAFAAKLLLEHYKIPKKYIRGLELAVKSKK